MFKVLLLSLIVVSWRVQYAIGANRCEEFQPCVQCQMFQTGPLDEVACAKNCNTFTLLGVDDVEDWRKNGDVLCSPMYDEDGCSFAYIYYLQQEQEQEEQYIIVKAEKERACRGSILGWILAPFAGLWYLLMWLWGLLKWLLSLLLKILALLLFGVLCIWLWKKMTQTEEQKEEESNRNRNSNRTRTSSSRSVPSTSRNAPTRSRPSHRSNPPNISDSDSDTDESERETNQNNQHNVNNFDLDSLARNIRNFWNQLTALISRLFTKTVYRIRKAYVTETRFVNGVPVSKTTREVPADELDELIRNHPQMSVNYN